ncbi:ras-related protein Rab-36 isoform X2 [Hydra vulgaris]|uniref:ras-related protein Rab-36 isoform X2 n=1 Tax=Hydra vulgaris TaxID=6087 RepID=UPI001F5F5342|nr:ras-related protein Rab-36-like isoform X2 [Hydra vulgaris]
MDGIITEFPKAFTELASHCKQNNFHRKTREACKTNVANVVSLKVAKCVVIGNLSVGKTSLINRWDTSGEERFKSITGSYYRGANVVFVVFDLSSVKSLTSSSEWFAAAIEKTQSTTPELFLVGNKVDIMKNVDLEETREIAINLANEHNAEYWEVSAKTGENVRELFTRAAALCFDQAVLRETESISTKIQMGNGKLIAKDKTNDNIVLARNIECNVEPSTQFYDKKSSNCCK